MKPTITSHTVVKNEDRYIWYVLQAVLPLIDRILIIDTGSTDQTVKIIKSINSEKISFQRYPTASADRITQLRQQLLTQTHTLWFLVLDGDEVWWQASLRKVITLISKHPQAYGVITPTINCVGDIYHYQDESAGRYTFAGRTGHLAVRMMRRSIPGIHVSGDYPLEGYYDRTHRLITDYSAKLIYLDEPLLHLTNLSRSTASETGVISRQKKYELGHKLAPNFRYPEVFYQHRPQIVPDPWRSASLTDQILGFIQTPLKKIKRKITT